MYRFDEQGRLRRAFVDGMLFRTSGHTLAMMERRKEQNPREPDSTPGSVLLRQDLSPDELNAFRERLRRELEELIDGLGRGEITRQHPSELPGLVPEFEQAIKVALESREFLAPAIVRR